jgi:hypothetical protein
MTFALSADEVTRIRAEEIARGNFPDVMDIDEAAIFMRRSVSWMERSNVPRSYPPGRVEGSKTKPLFLKSQLIAHLENHLTHRADQPLRRTG